MIIRILLVNPPSVLARKQRVSSPAFEDRGLVSYGYDQDGPEDEGDGGKTGHVHADET